MPGGWGEVPQSNIPDFLDKDIRVWGDAFNQTIFDIFLKKRGFFFYKNTLMDSTSLPADLLCSILGLLSTV